MKEQRERRIRKTTTTTTKSHSIIFNGKKEFGKRSFIYDDCKKSYYIFYYIYNILYIFYIHFIYILYILHILKHMCRNLFLKACNFVKTKTPAQVLFGAFAKFLRTSILQNICEWLLLKKEASKVTTLSETCHIFGVFDQNIKYLQQKIHEVMLIFVQCIKLDENKVSNRTFIRGYSETLSYSSFFIFWSPCCLKYLISKTVYTLNN